MRRPQYLKHYSKPYYRYFDSSNFDFALLDEDVVAVVVVVEVVVEVVEVVEVVVVEDDLQ